MHLYPEGVFSMLVMAVQAVNAVLYYIASSNGLLSGV